MQRFDCPHCGPRAQAEFTYERVLESVVDPAAAPETALPALFARTNPMGLDDELWRHTQGCRAWLVLRRDRVTHAVVSVRALGPEHLV